MCLGWHILLAQTIRRTKELNKKQLKILPENWMSKVERFDQNGNLKDNENMINSKFDLNDQK